MSDQIHPEKVSVVLTACGRPDLLRRTLASFFRFNTYPISQFIVIEDSGIPDINETVARDFPDIQWIYNEARLGQIQSIDRAYQQVTSPYVFHLEEDWEFFKPGFIEESLEILKGHPKVSAVMCRAHGDGAYVPSAEPPFLDCKNDWGFFSFNPGLRRLSDYRTQFPEGYQAVVEFDRSKAHMSEMKLNQLHREWGFRLAITASPEGSVRHIGDGRHVGEDLHAKHFKIGLCMIVKNESHIVHETLKSVLPIVDHYFVVDTGSTDGTQEVISSFLNSQGLSGEVVDRPWVDFGWNRSEALRLYEEKYGADIDYIFMIDADDLLEVPQNPRRILQGLIRAGAPSGCIFTVRQNTTLEYSRVQLFKVGDSWRYEGALHEYATNGKKGNKLALLPEPFAIISRRLGDRSRSPDKYLKDAAVLQKEFDRNPKNERTVFYLAQSYRDAGMKEKAIEYYQLRFSMSGWRDERYLAGVELVRLTGEKEWAWKAHEVCPDRIECLYHYLVAAREKGHYSQEHYAMAKYALTVKRPKRHGLFLRTAIYDWKLLDEFSVHAFCTGHDQEALSACHELVQNEKCPPEHRARVGSNIQRMTAKIESEKKKRATPALHSGPLLK
jgi:glycosyltransferase involved in cell wall biosynthesis